MKKGLFPSQETALFFGGGFGCQRQTKLFHYIYNNA